MDLSSESSTKIIRHINITMNKAKNDMCSSNDDRIIWIDIASVGRNNDVREKIKYGIEMALIHQVYTNNMNAYLPSWTRHCSIQVLCALIILFNFNSNKLIVLLSETYIWWHVTFLTTTAIIHYFMRKRFNIPRSFRLFPS